MKPVTYLPPGSGAVTRGKREDDTQARKLAFYPSSEQQLLELSPGQMLEGQDQVGNPDWVMNELSFSLPVLSAH